MGAGSAAILCTEGLDATPKEAWSLSRTISGVRLCLELEEPKGPTRGLLIRRTQPLYNGTSLIRNSAPLGPYGRNMLRALWWSWAGELFLMCEVPLYARKRGGTRRGGSLDLAPLGPLDLISPNMAQRHALHVERTAENTFMLSDRV